MIKIQALRRAFYNGEIIKAGQILNITSNKVPSWAKKIGGKSPDEDAVKAQKKDETETPAGEQKQLNINPNNTEVKPEDSKKDDEGETPNNEEVIVAGDGGIHPITTDDEKSTEENIPEDLIGKTDTEILTILDDLITKGVEVGVMIENAEKKTPVEQIIELRKLIEEKKQ